MASTPSTRDAVAVLRKHFGFAPSADSPDAGVGDPTGALELGGLRTDRQHEIEDQLDTALRVGDRGEALYRGSQLRGVKGDIANDPFTGDAEQARVGGIRGALDTAATTMRPEIGQAADTVAKRNAFADFLKTRGHAMGEFEAAGSPEALRAAEVPFEAKAGSAAQSAADADLARQQKLRMSPQLVPGQLPTGGDSSALDGGDGSGFSMPPNMKPLGADAEKAIRSMREVAPMLGELESKLDPSQSQVPNAITSRAKWALYKMGLTPTNAADQARLQLASLISIAGSAPYLQGSRNFEYLKQVQQHLTNPQATDQFLFNQVQELKKLWPSMQKEIMTAHINPSAPLNFGGGELPVTDPNRGR